MRHRFRRRRDARKPVFVDRMVEIGALAAPFHLDERDHPAPPGDEVDFTRGGPDPPAEHLPALGAQPHSCACLALAAAFLGQLAGHSERSAMARA